jgi:hypothetical protein
VLPLNVIETFYNLEDLSWNNKISSIMIPDGWSMIAYQGENGTGDWKCLTSSTNDLGSLTFDDGSSLNNSISSIVGYDSRSCPSIKASNFSFIGNPLAGEVVHSSFDIKNISGRPLFFEGVLVGVHGPFCETWDCENISDFPWDEDVIIQHGETYSYYRERAFNIVDDHYLLEFLTLDDKGVWNSYKQTEEFSVSRGIEIIDPVILAPEIPFVGQNTLAQFTIKNFGNRSIIIPNIMTIAKGPDCLSWDCPDGWADFPWVSNIILEPGEEYTYSQSRPFVKPGGGYFADAAFGDNNIWWYIIPNNTRFLFEVIEPLEIYLPLIIR